MVDRLIEYLEHKGYDDLSINTGDGNGEYYDFDPGYDDEFDSLTLKFSKKATVY